MKLYHLTQDHVIGYDTYSDCVVCAESAEDAISIGPNGNECPEEAEPYPSWSARKYVNAEYLGEAREGLVRGVICASFHAG